MLRLRKRHADRKPNPRRFAPTSPLDDGVARLEARALTAPAFWVNPLGPVPNNANARVWGNGIDQGGNNLATTDDLQNQPSGAAASGTLNSALPAWSMPIPGGGTWSFPGADFQMSGLATSQVNDLMNPGNGSGATNVGNNGVSASTNATLMWGPANYPPGSPAITNNLTATSGWSRSYTLADSNAAPPGSPPGAQAVYNPIPVYLHESFEVDYSPSPVNTGVNVLGGAGLATGPGLGPGGGPAGGVNVGTLIGNAGLGLPALAFEGVALPIMTPNPVTGTSASQTFTNPVTGNIIHATWTPTSIRVTTSVAIASLPYTTATGAVTGPNWLVNAFGTINAMGNGMVNGAGAQGSMASLTTNYGLSFSNYPTTP